MTIGGEDDILGVLDDPTIDAADDTGNDFGGQQQQQQPQTRQTDDLSDLRRQLRNDGNQPIIDTRQQQNNQQQNNQQQPNQQQNQQQQQPVDTRTLRPLGQSGLFTNARGDVIGRDGQVVATAGRERRLWQTAEQLRRSLTELTDQYQRLETEHRTNAEVNDLPRQYGLTADEVREGMTIVRQFKENPIAAIKDVVARGIALGYTPQQMIDPKLPGGSIDQIALNRMLEERLGPVQRQNEQLQRQEQQELQARRDLQRFFDDHEYSDIHADAIANLINVRAQQGQRLTPEKAYWLIREFALANNFDFSMPLQPQIQAAQSQQRQNGNPNPQQQQQQRRTTPSTGKHGAVTAQVTDQPEVYGEETDWKEIIRRQVRGVN